MSIVSICVGCAGPRTALVSLLLLHTPAFADPPDPDVAACKAADGKACLREAARAENAGHSAAAHKAYSRACTLGRGMGCIYLGQGAEPDKKKRSAWLTKAVEVFQKGCRERDAENCYFLGISYEQGAGTARDPVQALATYHLGCELGSVPACTNEAGCYRSGTGTDKDLARAAALFSSSCERDDLLACYLLGHIHEQELKTASDQSHVNVMSLGGNIDIHVLDNNKPATPSVVGKGPAIAALLKESPDKLSEGCKAGQPVACYKLGVILQVGGSAPAKSDAQALDAYEKACAAGSGWGCMHAGDLYQRGQGVQTNLGKAAGLYLKVCRDRIGGDKYFINECNAITDRMGL